MINYYHSYINSKEVDFTHFYLIFITIISNYFFLFQFFGIICFLYVFNLISKIVIIAQKVPFMLYSLVQKCLTFAIVPMYTLKLY